MIKLILYFSSSFSIAGFTAWSSIREPTHVFQLLESIFQAFDEEARRAGVFKVETVGDCYVAVAGVPEACFDHAEVMANFARRCLYQFNKVVRGLELILGPDTGDLAMRYIFSFAIVMRSRQEASISKNLFFLQNWIEFRACDSRCPPW